MIHDRDRQTMLDRIIRRYTAPTTYHNPPKHPSNASRLGICETTIASARSNHSSVSSASDNHASCTAGGRRAMTCICSRFVVDARTRRPGHQDTRTPDPGRHKSSVASDIALFSRAAWLRPLPPLLSSSTSSMRFELAPSTRPGSWLQVNQMQKKQNGELERERGMQNADKMTLNEKRPSIVTSLVQVQ
ncbi:uncharacterized protein N7482_001396 [Penicillium canariense]|uniref:Uncharacterized protein n=1 Tax=Penicillium canariense TaxID=189055 RepID=A0A9W9LTV3_9EURO|nr:uncharacterized protein N7482_001396 [Penicillium canariense]KAJ5175519.1 hypothetical protein N7482_001396 [Penicillium canariense]